MNSPFILLANVIFFAQVNKVCDGLCGEKLEAIDDVYLKKRKINIASVKSRIRNLGQKPTYLFVAPVSFPNVLSINGECL
jgi:hypothetical protein